MSKSSHIPTRPPISLRGVRQNNLKNFDLDIPSGRMTVVTGLSGSGKSSLVFDTLYAEGQRRYVETFSPYARQFLDRMNRPQVDKIQGIPPAIAIDQSASVRTSRSTVGTMSEINDHLKLLFAHSSHLYCPDCGVKVQHWHPQLIWQDIQKRLLDSGLIEARVYLTFPATFPLDHDPEGVMALLSSQGFTRILDKKSVVDKKAKTITHPVVADRFKGLMIEPRRALEAVELALNKGMGKLDVYIEANAESPLELIGSYREGYVCPSCTRTFKAPQANTFSFNSPLGACERCRGFGNTLEIDRDLVLDRQKSLLGGAIPFSHYRHFAETFEAMCSWVDWVKGLDASTPIQDLPPDVEETLWTGNQHFEGLTELFTYLESKSYKPHVKAFLNKYRRPMPCPSCGGAHLKPEGLWWRLGETVLTRQAQDEGAFKPLDVTVENSAYYQLPGLNFHEWMTLPIHQLLQYVRLNRGDRTHPQTDVWDELESRLHYLDQVGLGYLTLDRQSRTLSGGEVQRVNLTTALGTQLVNTLFLLDEPSIGLHPRDLRRVNDVMRRLTALGNTLVVVEHDPQVMLAGDELLDLGPGAGVHGGEIVYHGSTKDALKANTLTAQYLRGERRIERVKLDIDKQKFLELTHCTTHNLKDITLRMPLERLVVLAGVSGSGKSTLVENELIPALQARLEHRPLPKEGVQSLTVEGSRLSDIIHVDQSPVGQNARSTPATFVKAYDEIRHLFGTCAESVKRGFTPSDFSFNTGNGRCQTCMGTGVEHVEMQFLSDVDLPCPACHGKRFRDELLEVTLNIEGVNYSIHDVLHWTVDEAIERFKQYPKMVRLLSSLSDVGLGYLTLGQPLSTCSGGECQRLKLAECLAAGITSEGNGRRPFAKHFFIFDEPTNGLHFEDIRKLIDVADRLVKAGHSVLIIEHNLDMMNAADWVIEMGPEGGNEGGLILQDGTPDDIVASRSATGEALQAWRNTLANPFANTSFFELDTPAMAPLDDGHLHIVKATEHNLKDLTVAIPREGVTVVTGPSGSGKSTLAFDIIFAEGQRRYLESLNAYARSMLQPPPIPRVEEVRGLAPTVAIEQRTSRGGLRSTVATMTEIYHFLRLLYVKLGTPYCPTCHIPAKSQTPDEIREHIESTMTGTIAILAPVVTHQKGSFRQLFEDLRHANFTEVEIDGVWHPLKDVTTVERHELHNIAVKIGDVTVDDTLNLTTLLERGLSWGKDRVWAMAKDGSRNFYSLSSRCPQCNESFPTLDPRLFSYNAPIGACPTCTGYGVITEALKKAKPEMSVYLTEASGEDETLQTCPTCDGTRLTPFVRSVLWHGLGIEVWGKSTIDEAAKKLNTLPLTEREQHIGHDAIEEIRTRLKFLQDVGLGYLTLDRSAPTLSGGEAQRIRLAAQLGSNLQGACYILDEPTIGLHARDNAMLIGAMRQLANQGNTLIVVEHDEETIAQADFIVDIGPGSGSRGGELLVAGTLDELKAHPKSLTGQALKHPVTVPLTPLHAGIEPPVTITHLKANNVDVPTLTFKEGTLTVVTGVSGSGKSTLTRTLLYPRLKAFLETGSWPDSEGSIQNADGIQRLLEVDQTPIGKNPRSCPATYIGFFNAIRDLFAQTPESQMRGFGPERFSFNVVKGGRCPACEGQGMQTFAMSFMPDVKIECDTCHGMRFTPETLMVTWKGKSIGEVLQMQVDEAVTFFESVPKIHHPLKLMQDVGLGYLTLGQPSPTLSGGEAQRIKLVTELSKAGVDKVRSRAPKTLYVLDEPTVGLHMADVKKLMNVLNRLVDKGHTVMVVEHNLDLIAQADCVIDMGPEGGSGGGRIVGQGAPREIATLDTPTGRALADYFKTHKVADVEPTSQAQESQSRP